MTSARRRFGPRAMFALALALAVAVAACALASCGESNSTTASTTARTGTVQSVATPSASTRMICATEAQDDLSATLGLKTVEAPAPTWNMNTYTCAYVYTAGRFTLSVKQLADAGQTRTYFANLEKKLARRMTLDGLGQGAFTTADGSVVVQKDHMVLLVDVSRLPNRFGAPPDTRANVAISIAATIMGCWTGA